MVSLVYFVTNGTPLALTTRSDEQLDGLFSVSDRNASAETPVDYELDKHDTRIGEFDHIDSVSLVKAPRVCLLTAVSETSQLALRIGVYSCRAIWSG